MNKLSTIATLPVGNRPKILDDLYQLEKASEAGRVLETRYAVSALGYPEIDPAAFGATYLDKGLTLPVFAAFNLRGNPEIKIVVNEKIKAWQSDLEVEKRVGIDAPDLLDHLPLESVRDSHFRNEGRRLMPWFVLGALAFVVGLIWLYWQAWPAVLAFPSTIISLAIFTLGLTWIAVRIFRLFSHYRILTLTARFSGIMPQDVREKAHSVQGYFSDLYLVVDQQNRWEVSLAPAPLKIDLDPLLVGSKYINGRLRYFLIATFDLTMAEDYIKQEFTDGRSI